MAKIKVLTREDWLEPGERIGFFVSASEPGNRRQISPEEWRDQILAESLPSRVPESVRVLFEVAKGSMVYGCFY